MTTPETITADDLLDAMARAGVLEAFCRLPRIDQMQFSLWIGKARDNASHWRRIEALVSAIETSSPRRDRERAPRFNPEVLG